MLLNEINSIYATPSIILRASGSVGVTFVMWLLGVTIAAAGTAVYIELGTVRDINYTLPRLTRIYAGLASEWRGKELSRVYIPTAQIFDYLHICCVCFSDGAYRVGLGSSFFFDLRYREWQRRIVLFVVNVSNSCVIFSERFSIDNLLEI